MKSKKISKKLVLKRATVANLNGTSMGKVYGGADTGGTDPYCLTPISCVTCNTCNTCETCNNCTVTVGATCGGDRTCDTFCCSDVLCPG